MAEELFTDIIKNLGKSFKKAKQEGKITGGYRFSDDGKLKVGGGYYDEDKMFEIEVGKDNANVLFKKRFADGGITTPKRGFVDGPGSYSGQSSYANVQKLGIETQIKQMYAKGLGAGTITIRLKNLYKGQPNIANKINRTLIGDYLTYAQRNLNLVKPVGDIAVRNQYGPIRSLEQVQKVIDEAPKIKKGKKYYDMNAKDLEGRSKWNHTDPKQSVDGKKGTKYVTRKEIIRYNKKGQPPKLKISGPSKITLIDDAKFKANVRRGEKTKTANANAGAETVAENKKISTKFVTQANLKLRQDLKKNSIETINKIRNNKKIMFELENSFDSKSGEFKTEKVSNKKIKSLIKGGMFSMEHTSPMVAGAKNTNFTTNLSLITNRANSKIMRPLDTFLNSNSYKDFSDPRVVKAKNFLSKNNLRIKIKNDGKPIYFGDETKFESAAERINKQSKGYRLNSGLAAVENGARGIFSNVKNVAKNIAGNIKNIGNVDFSNMSLGEGKLAKAAGVGKNIVKVGGKLLGAAAIPLTAYELNRMYNEGSTAAEMLAYPLFLDGRVREGQELLKMSKAEKQSMMNQQIEEDESLLDSDFSTPYVKGVNSVDNKIVRERVALELQAEKEARKLKRTKKSSGFTFGNNYGISSFDDQVWNN